jgi:protein subunit release factor A
MLALLTAPTRTTLFCRNLTSIRNTKWYNILSVTKHTEELIKKCEINIDNLKKIYENDIQTFNNIESIITDTNRTTIDSDLNISEVMQEYNVLSKRLNILHKLEDEYNHTKEFFELVNAEVNKEHSDADHNDNVDLYKECQKKINLLLSQCKQMYITSKMDGEADCCSSIFLEVTAGAGGDDANDWASILLKMYYTYFDNNNNSNVVIEEKNVCNGTGRLRIHAINSDFNGNINDMYLYGMLKHEIGYV